MKTTSIPSRSRGFTLIELLVVISIIAILAGLALPAFQNIQMEGRITSQVSNAKQVLLCLKQYALANDGQFPSYKDKDDAASVLGNANDAFETLMPRYLDDKAIFGNKQSEWANKVVAKTEANRYKLAAGENDFVYVRGLSENSPSVWPIVANAFAQGAKTYVADASKKGGVWRGKKAVVGYVAGNVEPVELKEQNDTFYIRRKDKPTSNAFESDDDWLNGENVEVLYPL